ncbi:uncharacterized protein LOC122539256 [Chiloscyllium plagiosum]|uniref:uncharacterized protein LOC122539256 n=1 Tax=Chiloscyllium plagiosum TaxID=36176 RepID=UPI001CB7CEDF|nr:uncharacterized protein LOC122539256 [Chiloscyllium plagiosum]
MLTVSMVTRRRTELLFLKEPAVELEFLIVAQSRITESLSLTMGIYSSTFHQSGGQLLLEFTDPSQANWITSHAEACQMTIPEVQRYWGRFVLLQPDRDGNVPLNRFLTKEIFSHQLLEQMPLTPDGLMTFQTFCNAVSWFSKASVETKLRALHQTLTFKSPLNQDALQPLLQDVYPSEPSETISQLSQLLMSEVDRKRQAGMKHEFSEDVIAGEGDKGGLEQQKNGAEMQSSQNSSGTGLGG